MPDSFQKFQRSFEIFANQQSADVEAVRAVLQGLVVQLLANDPQGRERFQALRKGVLDRLDNETKLSAHDQAAKRKAEFVHIRAALIFDEMAPVFGSEPAGSSGQSH